MASNSGTSSHRFTVLFNMPRATVTVILEESGYGFCRSLQIIVNHRNVPVTNAFASGWSTRRLFCEREFFNRCRGSLRNEVWVKKMGCGGFRPYRGSPLIPYKWFISFLK